MIRSVRKYTASVDRHSYLVTSAFCSCWVSQCRQHLTDGVTWPQASDSTPLEPRLFLTSFEKKRREKVTFIKFSFRKSCLCYMLITYVTVMLFHLPFAAIQVIFTAIFRNSA